MVTAMDGRLTLWRPGASGMASVLPARRARRSTRNRATSLAVAPSPASCGADSPDQQAGSHVQQRVTPKRTNPISIRAAR